MVAAGLAAAGCDNGGAKSGGDTGASAAPPSTASAPPAKTAERPPEPPRAPTVTLDERALTVDGTTFTGDPSEWRDRAAALLGERPLVSGEAVVVNVMRDVKAPKVAAALAALATAKAKSAVIRTPTRDQSTGELELTFRRAPAPDCSAVAMIEHDGAVAIWSKGGGGAQRFARGMAGPDLSTSTDALKKRAGGCDSPAWFLSAADNVQWGLEFDLALRARGGDAGPPLKATQTVLLAHTPTPGRHVKED